MARNHSYTFTVEGSGNFPLDMLRYDCCYPVSSEDAAKLDSNPHEPACYRGRREIKLRMDDSSHGPTVDRWASFNWTCKEIELLR